MAEAFNTAYREAIKNFQSSDDESSGGSFFSTLPSYMVETDSLNVANRNQTFLESANDTLNSIPKFIGLSLISGVNQLYNIPADIGNLFGGEFETRNTEDIVAEFDDDLGMFYQEHQEGIDLVGFIASSLVPGIGGVKVLNAGQQALRGALGAGKYGEGTAKALGLLVPKKELHLSRAIQEVTHSNSAVSLLNRNALRSMAAGLGQSALEATAFEVAVAATMFNSPILENQTMGDLISNIALGIGVFAPVGGVVDAVKISSSIKKAKIRADEVNRPWTFVDGVASSSKPYEKVTLDFEQIASIPPIPENMSADRRAFLTNATRSKTERLENRIRTELGVLTNGDEVIAGTLFETFKRQSLQDQQSAFIGLDEITRMAEVPRIEKKLDKLQKKIQAGKATVKEINEFTNTARSFTKVWGEETGRVTVDSPVITNLIDTLGKNQHIEVTRTGVTAGKRRYDFSADYNLKKDPAPSKGKPRQSWNIFTADPFEAGARYIWASKLKKFAPDKGNRLRIQEDDIPLLEKAMRDLDEDMWDFVDIVGQDGKPISVFAETIKDMVIRKKTEVVNGLHDATTRGVIFSDPEVALAKIRSILGINFNVAGDLPIDTNAQWARFSSGPNAGFGAIQLNRNILTTKPLHEIISTILHEEGHIKFDTILDVGGIPPSDFVALKDEILAASKLRRPESWESVTEGSKYWEYLNSTHELMADAFAFFSQFPNRMAIDAPNFERLYGHLTRPLPKELVDSYAARANQLTQEEIAAMVNVKSSYLDGLQVKDGVGKANNSDIFAMQDHAEKYTQLLRDQGSWTKDELVDIWNVPQHAKLTYDVTPFEAINGHVIENMVIIKEQQVLYQAGTRRAAAGVLGQEWVDQAPDINSAMVYQGANSAGAGAGFVSAASSNYGTLAATTEQIGNLSARTIERFKAQATEVLDPLLYRLSQNEEAAIEWSVLNAQLRGIEDVYGIAPGGVHLEPIKILQWKEAAEAAQLADKVPPPQPVLLNSDSPLEIPMKNAEVQELAAGHVEINGRRTSSYSSIRSAQGVQYQRDPAALYPIPVDPKDFPFFAMVTDDSITGTGHSTTLYATNAADLDAQIAKLKDNPQLTIRTKKQAEDYFAARGQWDYEKTLSDNYLDVTKHRSGVSQPFAPSTDVGKITSDVLNWHTQRETGLVREAVSANYEVQFQELRRLGDDFTDVETSKFTNLLTAKFAGDAVKNPFRDYVNTALAIKKNESYPVWVALNRMSDEAVTSMYRRATGAIENAKSEEDILRVNALLEKAGYKGAAYDESMQLFANARAEKGDLTRAIQKSNSILATVVLRLDALNAVNNAVSANVLLGAETKAVVRAINRGDSEAVGALADLTRLAVPGTDKTIFSAGRMIAKAVRNFNAPGSEAQMQFYKDIGVVTSISKQYRDTLDQLTYTGKDVAGWDARINGVQKKLSDAADTGEKWTGNRLAEEFNRFVAADVMKQMTDVAVSRGLMAPKQQLAYINTFVNRTQGNYLAAQRPMMFQGPIGQAIGLFQTYQFNLMQQLLRHVGEGHAKDSMTLLALQGTIHGMNGLPGFNALNTHVVGTASGNQEHRDAYTSVYGIAGKQGGDWLMYGMASNALGLINPDLKVNLYTRGDINPRHVTIVPTNPASVPIVQASARFFSNLFNTTKQLAKGGDVTTTLLQGLEHNSISRPLAGLAQTLQGIANPADMSYSTSRKGNVIAANDLLSLANLGRIVGGKPLDEAIAQDAAYRYKAYGLVDTKRKAVLGQSIKSTMIAGGTPTQEQVEDFAHQYAAIGGKQKEFVKWMGQLQKTANLAQANELARSSSSPFAQDMQQIMGGRELRGFE